MSGSRAKTQLGLNENRPAKLPPIIVTGKQLREQSDAALAALSMSNTPPSVFVRGGEVVRLVADETGKPMVVAFSEAALRGRLSRVANFFKRSGGRRSPVLPPAAVAKDILALGTWGFPGLSGVVEVPVLRPDGTILDKPGYDLQTRLFYWPGEDLDVPPIPESPTSADVQAAVAVIDDIIGDFPFDSPASKANALGALLTPIVRAATQGPVPLALLDAPQQGSGKSLLASVIALTATGRPNAMIAAPDSDEEWRKSITAVLRSGATVITLDNIEGQLKAPSLANALTAEVWKSRILGRSEDIELPQLATWLATGNNIRLGGDLQRRCYQIRLDAQSATPWMGRQFRHPDLKDWVRQNRGKIIAALLTLARAWFAADRPKGEGPVLGSYEAWSSIVGGILENAGVAGFLGNLGSLYQFSDEEGTEWEEFLAELARRFGANPFTTGELTVDLTSNPDLRASLPDDLGQDWNKRNDGVSFVRRLGKAFSSREGRRHGDSEIRVERAGKEHRAQKWRVVKTLPPVLEFPAAEPEQPDVEVEPVFGAA
jgi:hypothetical protein